MPVKVTVKTDEHSRKRYRVLDFEVGDLVRGGDEYWSFLAIVVNGPEGVKTIMTLESDDHENGSSPFSIWRVGFPEKYNLQPVENDTIVTLFQQSP